MIDIESLAHQSGITQYVAANNKTLERFVDLMLEEIFDVVYGSDPRSDDKTGPQEPYSTIADNIADRFYK